MKNFTKHIIPFLILLISLPVFSQVKLSSLTSASATIFLDFDGHTVQSAAWNNGNKFVCTSSGLNDVQITEIFHRVSEDYRPFNVNITTDSSIFLAAPLNKRVRMIVTLTSNWYQGVGGVAYIGSFTWGDDTPGFIFPDRLANVPKYIAECCTHESGHTIGLSHQSAYNNSCGLVDPYNPGSGSGEAGWAPVMGNSYYKNMTGWYNGPTPYGCENTQDNLTIITTQNGFGYRADDYNDEPAENNFLLPASSFSVSGIISTNVDKDAFKLVLANNENLHIDVTPFGLNSSNSGANLDVKVFLYNQSKTLIRTYDPLNSLSVSLDTSLIAGTYYLVVKGTGNVNAAEYGSLGSYTLSGTSTKVLAIRDVKLFGNSRNDKHNLDWSIVCDEPIVNQTLEVSKDGSHFENLGTISNGSKVYSYQPNLKTTLFYRLKITSSIGQTAYSNIISLQAVNGTRKQFTVATLVQQEMSIQASEKFEYALYDMKGRLLLKGNGNNGLNKISAANLPAGLFVIQLQGNNFKQTERIIKQ